MAHTKRELIQRVAEKLGGEYGAQLEAMLQQPTLLDEFLDCPLSDEEFESLLATILADIPRAVESMKSSGWEKPGTWGLPN